MITKINVDIKWSNKKNGEIIFSNGVIILSEDSIKVKAELSKSKLRKFSATHPAYIDIFSDLSKNIIYDNPTINGSDIKLEIPNPSIISFRSNSPIGIKNATLEQGLSTITYSIKKESPGNKLYIINIPFFYLSEILGELEDFPKPIEFPDDKYTFVFSGIDDNPNYTIVKTNADEDAFEKLRVHMAFYFNSPVEVICRTEECTHEKMLRIIRSVPRFSSEKETLSHPELAYMNITSDGNSFINFVHSSKWDELKDSEIKNHKQAVYTFVRSKFSDDTMQFLTIYSILDRFAGNKIEYYKQNGKKKTAPFKIMENGLNNYHIDINKIGKENDRKIMSLRLCLQHENEIVKVRNFCDLRDYILHYMTTPEIDELLTNIEIVKAMRFTATVIMLEEFGLNDFSFKDDWKHLSILKEIKEKC